MSVSGRIGWHVPRLAPWTAGFLAAAALASGAIVRVPGDHQSSAAAPPTNASWARTSTITERAGSRELSAIEAAALARASNPAALRSLLLQLLNIGPDLPPSLQARLHALTAALVRDITTAVGRSSSVSAEPSSQPSPTPAAPSAEASPAGSAQPSDAPSLPSDPPTAPPVAPPG